jgi:5-dehydro-2-deoxygluconokinase
VSASPPAGPEVLTIGRISVDLYPEQLQTPLARVETFRKFLGGSPTNVAVAAARLGRTAAVVTKVGDDGFGAYTREALAGFGEADPVASPRTQRRWSSKIPKVRFSSLWLALWRNVSGAKRT